MGSARRSPRLCSAPLWEAPPTRALRSCLRPTIYNIDLVIETDDVAPAAARAAALAETSGGFVANESTEGTDSATLTLRIPSARHTTVVRDLEELGEVEHRSRTAEDVTAEVVDVEARVASQRRSIARIRELLDQAGDLSDVVRIEAELAIRRAGAATRGLAGVPHTRSPASVRSAVRGSRREQLPARLPR
jgi:hypothetical protein